MTQQQLVLGPALMADLKHISNAELTKAIQLVEQAFQLSASEPTRAYNLFEKSSIAFLQAIRTSDAEHREVVRKVVDVYILHIELERVKLSARASGEQNLAPAGTAAAAQQQKTAATTTTGRSQSKLSRLSSSEPLPQRRDSHSYLQLVAVEERSDSESRSGSGECGTKLSHLSSAGGGAAAAAAKSKKKASRDEKKKTKKTSSSSDKDRRKEEGKEREKSAKHQGKEEKDGSNGDKKQEEKSEQRKKEKEKKRKEKKEGKKEKKEAKEKRKRKNTCELIEVETISSTRKRPDEGSRRASTPSRSASTIVASSSPSLTPASSSDSLGEDSLDDARLLRALNGWRKARGHGSSDILGYCSLRPTTAEERKEKTTTPTADQADESMERRTDDKAAAAAEQPADELHKLYPNLHSAFCNKLLDKWVQEQPNNTI